MTNEEWRRRERYMERKRRRRRWRIIRNIKSGIIICLGVLLIFFTAKKILEGLGVIKDNHIQKVFHKEEPDEFKQKVITQTPDYQVELLTPNPYSRPQTALNKVKGIVIHYTANPGTTAIQNRNYFEGLKDSQSTKASSHFVIGLEGEVIQCIPSMEISYASNDRNEDTLSIECCHMDETGQFTQETYDSLVQFTAWLCGKFNIPVENVIRHYDVTGKDCPRYFVSHEDAWEDFKKDVQRYLDTYGVEPEENEELQEQE